MKWNWQIIREYLFYLLIFTLPWQTRWIIRDPYLGGEVWEYGRISLYGWDILLVLLFLISLPLVYKEISRFFIKSFSLGVEDSELRSPSSTPNNPAPGTLFILLFIFSFLSIFWASDKTLALVWSLRLLEAGLLWLVVQALKPKWIGVMWSLIVAGTVQAGWAIWQFLSQASFANKWLGVAVHPLTQGGTSVVMNEYGRWLRAYAGQVHPNVLGGLLVITLFATAYLYLAKKSEIQSTHHTSPGQAGGNPKFEIAPTADHPQGDNSSIPAFSFRILSGQKVIYILFALYIIQLVALFFTFSRGAWLALFLSLIWWYLSSVKLIRPDQFYTPLADKVRDRKLITSLIFVSAITVIILGAIYWQPLSGRFTGASTLEQQSIEDRRGSIKESRGILSTKWILGTGVGNYTAKLAQNIPNLKAWRYQPAHNVFLLVFTELGIIGLLLFLLLLWQRLRPFIIHNSLFIIPILVTSMFDHYWWTAPSMFLLLWFIIVGIELKQDTP